MIHAALYGRGRSFSEIKEIGESLLQQAKKTCPSIFCSIETLEKGEEEKEIRLRQLVQNYKISRESSI